MEEKRGPGRPKGKRVIDMKLNPSGKTNIQIMMPNNYVEFLRDITFSDKDNPLRPVDFLTDILNLFHRLLLKNPDKLENLVGNALFGKYFEHLAEQQKEKITK